MLRVNTLTIVVKYKGVYKRCFITSLSIIGIALIFAGFSCTRSSPSRGNGDTGDDQDKTGEGQLSPSVTREQTREITDAAGRQIAIPVNTDEVICSGSGCLRLLTYLNAYDRIVAVDGIEVKGSPIDARPYAIANPEFKTYPVFGEFRGYDNPELIAGLNPQPDVIFKMQPGGGISPDMLTNKTGIPVIVLFYGNLTYNRQALNRSLQLMGEVVNKKERAKEVISYIDSLINDLKVRGAAAESSPPACYVGGLGQSGPHGIQSTDAAFAPFAFLELPNVAGQAEENKQISHLNVAKEQIIAWDPDFIFIDISTLRLGGDINALEQLRSDPSLENLSAVKNKQVYGLFPNYSYNQNIEVVLANAYFIGKTIYPESFTDIHPKAKAEEISVFLNGGPSFGTLNEMFGNTGFTKIALP